VRSDESCPAGDQYPLHSVINYPLGNGKAIQTC
jgi:hypothetical protein